MKEIIDINCVYQSLEDLDFEGFDDIFLQVESDYATFNKKDIIPLCKIIAIPYMSKPYEYMEPHQYLKVEKMILFTLKNNKLEEGFDELSKGLEEIIKTNYFEASQLIKLTMNSFSKEDNIIFGGSLKKNCFNSKEELVKILSSLIEKNGEIYGEKGMNILNILQKK